MCNPPDQSGPIDVVLKARINRRCHSRVSDLQTVIHGLWNCSVIDHTGEIVQYMYLYLWLKWSSWLNEGVMLAASGCQSGHPILMTQLQPPAGEGDGRRRKRSRSSTPAHGTFLLPAADSVAMIGRVLVSAFEYGEWFYHLMIKMS